MNDQHEQARNALSEAALAHQGGDPIRENNWLARAQTLSLFSIADSLREIIAWARPEDEPDGQAAEYAALCSGLCVLLPGHDGLCVPPAPAAPASRADGDLGAPVTGPFPAMIP